jgi:hypothetical protein
LNIKHGTHQANRPKVYWGQGPSQATLNQGCPKVCPGL